jgi:hypothetical protein
MLTAFLRHCPAIVDSRRSTVVAAKTYKMGMLELVPDTSFANCVTAVTNCQNLPNWYHSRLYLETI